jgi:serine/threonine protein kinase
MNPERWQQIEQLYHSALEREPDQRSAFLAEASQDDHDLRREVESLLAQETKSAGLMDAQAWERAASLAGDPAVPELAEGTQLGPYRIEVSVGAGGMGRVYRARDSRLGRAVAIKVSAEQFSARFEQEARLLASLNHPHICTLHDVGPNYLVMELLEGKTLAERLKEGRLPLDLVLRYGAEIADALAAAHSLGVIHRDLKPGNIMVTNNGVKVLDFGLANLSRSTNALLRQAETATEPHAIMGTPAYMAPEQVCGEEVDGRTDLFSFGAVLYEMATGKRAFPRYLDRTTPPAVDKDSELQRIIDKLLKTDPELRYQTASEVSADLRQLQRTVEGTPPPGVSRRWMIGLTGAALAAITLGAVFLWLRSPGKPQDRSKWVQITNFPDSVSQPALSPDGRMLTFIRGPSSFITSGQVYVKMLPSGEPVQLTHDDRPKMSPAFSPDGSRIAYTVVAKIWDTWAVPVLGGEPRLWLPNASGLGWIGKIEAAIFRDQRSGSAYGDRDRR